MVVAVIERGVLGAHPVIAVEQSDGLGGLVTGLMAPAVGTRPAPGPRG